MAKGDDAVAKNRNKAIRKRMRRAGGDTVEAMQGVQAHKRRRKAGLRRNCEGMCYKLPTPQDPFLDNYDRKKQREKNRELRKAAAIQPLEFETLEVVDTPFKENPLVEGVEDPDADLNAGYDKQLKRRKVVEEAAAEVDQLEKQKRRKKRKLEENQLSKQESDGAPSKVIVPESLKPEDIISVDNGQMVESRGSKVEFFTEMVQAVLLEAGLIDEESTSPINVEWKQIANEVSTSFHQQCWESHGKVGDILASCSLGWEERAVGYVTTLAAHIREHRRKLEFPRTPVVLIIVSSQEQALQVRRVCKVLKTALAISSVCLHTGTSIDHQSKGLKTQTPDIIVATPDRLCELLAVQSITLSSLSLLVVDGLAEIIDKGLQSHLSKVKQYISESVRKLVISDSFPETSVLVTRQLVADPIVRVISESNLESKCICITQAISVFTNVSKRKNKMLKILQQFWEMRESNLSGDVLIVMENEETVQVLLPEVQHIGFAAVGLVGSDKSNLTEVSEQLREGSVRAFLTTDKHLCQVPLERIQLVVNYSFPVTLQTYTHILTGMARESANGLLHSFCTAAMAPLACELVHLLETCFQDVPHALQMFADAAALVQRALK